MFLLLGLYLARVGFLMIAPFNDLATVIKTLILPPSFWYLDWVLDPILVDTVSEQLVIFSLTYIIFEGHFGLWAAVY